MKIDTTQSAWFKKYMPQTIDDMILPQKLKTYLIDNLTNDTLPHLGLFSLNPGTGKSSLAESILNDHAKLGGEAILINASLDNGKGTIENKLSKFSSAESFGGRKKIVLMDEFDSFTPQGQLAFRGFIDEFSDNCTFIFTGNYKSKIIEPMLDRMQVYDFQAFAKAEMIPAIFERLKFILDTEEIQYEPKEIIPVINTFYPSIRSMVGALQKFSTNAKFSCTESELDDIDSFSRVLQSVKSKDFQSVLEQVANINAPDNYYIMLYKNINEFIVEKRPLVTITIAKYQHMSTSVRDKNVNLSACLTEIMMNI